MMSTNKSIKGHAYDNAKKAWTKVKEGKGYIYDKTINLSLEINIRYKEVFPCSKIKI